MKILTNSALKAATPLLPHLMENPNIIWVARAVICRALCSAAPRAKAALHSAL
jgi:hypothetical protein